MLYHALPFAFLHAPWSFAWADVWGDMADHPCLVLLRAVLSLDPDRTVNFQDEPGRSDRLKDPPPSTVPGLCGRSTASSLGSLARSALGSRL